MFRDVFRKKGNFNPIIISTVLVTTVGAMVIAVGVAAAQSNVTTTTGISTTTAGSPTDPSTADLIDSDCVDYAALVSTTDLPDGGKTYTYSLDGNLIPEQVPPAGWDPLTASSESLHRYGLGPKPSDPTALQSWSAKMSRLKFTGKPFPMCRTDKNYGLTVIANGFPWAGGMAVNGTTNYNTFYWAKGKWLQTAFQSSSCVGASDSGYGTWAGLGGKNHPRLIQAGTSASSSSLNGIYPFFELINERHNDPAWAFAGNVINGGDDIEADAYYDTANIAIYMYVGDYTTGQAWYIGPIHTWYGELANNYWDGTTADFVTESPTRAGVGTLRLRRPFLDNTYYYYATVNDQPIANFYSWRLYETNPQSHIQMQASSFDGIHAWYDSWTWCW